MFLTPYLLSDVLLYTSAIIVTLIGGYMLWKLSLHRHTFNLERFKKKWPNGRIIWKPFWKALPVGTSLKIECISIGDYRFTVIIGEESTEVNVCDWPSGLRAGQYRKTFSGIMMSDA